LASPNSILIRGEISPTQESGLEKIGLPISPNPASEIVRVVYNLEKTAEVRVEVLNGLGQKVATLYSGKQVSGEHEITWNGMAGNGLRVQAGMYFLRLAVGDEVTVGRVVLKKN